ncbi:hypothetical protein [Helicobacter mehlei]|uniref:hypothetical protein n=1 Tax=Helicobacter mehlei TaxID=2316080 RepID=UPI000EADA27F|nr:hypothetical protein [Helicobacter mehlei]
MEVKDIQSNSLHALLNASNLGRGVAPSSPTLPVAPPKVEAVEQTAQVQPDGLKRETYGFLVLELMSDNEYQAFLRATAGMNENEKRLAAQSLYSLTSFYGGQIQEDKQTQEKVDGLRALQETQVRKAFGIDSNFVNRYKNAYNQAYQAMDLLL